MQSQLGRSSMQDTQAPTNSESEHYLNEINARVEELYKKLEPVLVNFPQVENQKEPQTSALIAALRNINEKLTVLSNGIII